MAILSEYRDLYLQMIDPTLPGPASQEQLGIFESLNALGVIAVRPILLAMHGAPDAIDGMRFILRLVVRRIVVGNLGTGNVERRFGEAAKRIHDTGDWRVIVEDLSDLNPSKADFTNQLKRRSLNKSVLSFVRRSVLQETLTPSIDGTLYFIWTRQTPEVGDLSDEDGAYWASTLGNSLLSNADRRPRDASNWTEFRNEIVPTLLQNEPVEFFEAVDDWTVEAIEQIGSELSESAADVWY